MDRPRRGPLAGVAVLEFAGLGPTSFCGMLLSDMGADVLRIERPGAGRSPHPILERGRRQVVLDLKGPAGQAAARRLAERADILIEGYRPGVMERLGLGPDEALELNPRLVYGRMTGWGREGPYAAMPGHDVNYVALTGALHLIGTKARPVMPLNLVGDHGGGGAFLTIGVLAALQHARTSGQGQVVDAAMIDGVSMLMTQTWGALADGRFRDEREANTSNGAAHYMGVYECADGAFISFASFEPQFYRAMLEKLGLAGDPLFQAQHDRALWPQQKARMAEVVAGRTRAEWCALLEGSEACFAPVLSMREAAAHPHNQARAAFVERDGRLQPAPAPRFSATPSAIQGAPPEPADHDRAALRDWGLSPDEVAACAPGRNAP